MSAVELIAPSTARAQLDRTKGHWQGFWYELKDFHENRRWLDLGYASFEACVEAELHFTKQRAYQLLAAAEVHAQLSSQDVLTLEQMKTGHAEVLAPLPPAQRLEVARSIDFAATTTAELRQFVKAARVELQARTETTAPAVTPPLPVGRYRCIVVDPPWPVEKIARDLRPNQPDHLDYPTMTLDEITALPIADLAEPSGCHVCLWVTHRFLADGLHLLDAWACAASASSRGSSRAG